MTEPKQRHVILGDAIAATTVATVEDSTVDVPHQPYPASGQAGLEGLRLAQELSGMLDDFPPRR